MTTEMPMLDTMARFRNSSFLSLFMTDHVYN
jgi:hypothetical protein